MLRHPLLLLISVINISGIVLLPNSWAQAAVLYKLDTISPGTNSPLFPVGLEPKPDYTGQIVGDLMWLNSYQVAAGGELIKSIDLTWGAPPRPLNTGNSTTPTTNGLADWQNRAYPATVLLYSDPNNDGNPNDAKLLAQADTTIANPNTPQFTTTPINPTELKVGQTFFVGALVRNVVRDQRPATADLSSTNPGRSWFAIGNHGDAQPSNIDINNLANNFNPSGGSESPVPLPSVYGNWVLRAYGDDAIKRRIPEPSVSLGLGLVSLLAIAARRVRTDRDRRK